jgi:Flp pilus assembly protein TadG
MLKVIRPMYEPNLKATERRRRGAAVVEFALVLPILVVLLGGIIDFGRAYLELQTMVNAAGEGARMAIVSSDPNVDVDAVKTRVRSFFPDWSPGSDEVYVDGMGAAGSTVTVTVTRHFDQFFLGVLNLLGPIDPLPNELTYTASGRRQ